MAMTAGTRPTQAAGIDPRRRRRWPGRLLLVLLAGLLVSVLSVAAVVAVLWPLTPSVADAEQRVAARLAQHGAVDPHALASPNRVGLAIIATEDSRFYAHHGVDALGVARAALAALGGSAHDM